MNIDYTTYKLSEKNYVNVETIKKQIIIGHTSTSKENNYTKYTNRLNGNYNKTATYTIGYDGVIYNHFEPIYFSNFFDDIELDKKVIIILLENYGWLVESELKNSFLNWNGDIYKGDEPIVEKKWRNQSHWAPYTKQQFESTIYLVNMICDEFFLPKTVIAHNTKIDKVDDIETVLYKSNILKNSTDLNPSWDFINFKNKIENYEK